MIAVSNTTPLRYLIAIGQDDLLGRLMGFLDDFPQVLKQLKASGFFIASSLEQQLLQRNAARRVK